MKFLLLALALFPIVSVLAQDLDIPRECIDSAEEGPEVCYLWALAGECSDNPRFMNMNCRRTCGFCDSKEPKIECRDADEGGERQCKEWAWHGDCERNPEYMHGRCRKTCGICKDDEQKICKDIIPAKCREWKEDDRCTGFWEAQYLGNTVNSAYVVEMCPESCGVCDVHLDDRDSFLGIGLPQTAHDVDDKHIKNRVRQKVQETREYIQSLEPGLQEVCQLGHVNCARATLSNECYSLKDREDFKYLCAAACKKCQNFDADDMKKAKEWLTDAFDEHYGGSPFASMYN